MPKSKATETVEKQLKKYAWAYYITEFLPMAAGLITAMILNPHVWAWLIFILLAVLLIGGLIACFSKSFKTILWRLILIITLAIKRWIMYLIITTCFIFAAVNDIWLGPKYKKLKTKFEQYKNMDEYQNTNMN